MPSRDRPHIPTLSFPVAVAFFLLTNAVFCFMAYGWYFGRHLAEHGEVIDALITHKWKATRWSDDHYIGYAFVDSDGAQQTGSARIKADSQIFYEIGEEVEVLVDLDTPGRSALAEKSHLSVVERTSSSSGVAVLMGILAILSWWLFIARVRRSWRTARQSGD